MKVRNTLVVTMVCAGALGCERGDGGHGRDGRGDGGEGIELIAGPGGCFPLPNELRVTDAAGASEMPRIAWDGSGYVVVWSDARSGNGDIYSARISRDGRKVAGDQLIAGTPTPSRRPTVAARPGGYVVAWEEELGGQTTVMNAALSARLEVVTPPEPLTTSGTEQGRAPAAAFGGNTFVGWMERGGADTGAAIARFGTGGIEMRVMMPTRPAMFPALAAGGSQLGIGFVEGSRVKLAIAGKDLAFSRELMVSDGAGTAALPTLAWNGQSWTVAWEDKRSGREEIWVALVNDAGTRVGPARLHRDQIHSANWPSAAANGGLSAIAYYAFVSGAEVMVTLVDAEGRKRGADLRLTNSPGAARYPWTAAGDREGEFAVVWQDTRFDGDAEIMFARLTCMR